VREGSVIVSATDRLLRAEACNTLPAGGMDRWTMRETEIPAFDDLQWLAAFARRLARDADDADDLVQETLVTAWRHAPPQRTGLRPWLAMVLRNRWRMTQRGANRREARDAAASPDVIDAAAPDAVVARIRVLGQLTAALETLAPEDQQLIDRRFLQGQSAAEIARAMSIPAGTVRSRISRLMAELRARLDARCDGRDAWCAAVLAVPTAVPAGSVATTASTTGATAMPKPILFIILATTTTATAGAYVGLARPDGDERVPAAAMASGTAATPAAATPVIATPVATTVDRASAPARPSRERWTQTRQALSRALEARPPTEPATERTDTRMEYARLVMACVRDIEDQPAKFSLEITEIGAPDIGTIVAEAKVVGSNITNPEILECAEQSMYAFEGPAPAVPFERTFRMGMQAPKRSPEQLAIRLHYYMDAHFEDVRACEPKGVTGWVDLDVTSDEHGKITKVDVADSTADATTVACIVAAASSWTFPEPVTTETTRHRYTLPVHDLRIAE
jgi:RNA polymerase sigma-70 factor (ECF subfamily)